MSFVRNARAAQSRGFPPSAGKTTRACPGKGRGDAFCGQLPAGRPSRLFPLNRVAREKAAASPRLRRPLVLWKSAFCGRPVREGGSGPSRRRLPPASSRRGRRVCNTASKGKRASLLCCSEELIGWLARKKALLENEGAPFCGGGRLEPITVDSLVRSSLEGCRGNSEGRRSRNRSVGLPALWASLAMRFPPAGPGQIDGPAGGIQDECRNTLGRGDAMRNFQWIKHVKGKCLAL